MKAKCFLSTDWGDVSWEDCANNRTCAEMCAAHYLNQQSHRQTNCGRGSIGKRTCSDYGIIHAFGRDACLRKADSNPDVLSWIKWMEEECGVVDQPRLDQTTTSE